MGNDGVQDVDGTGPNAMAQRTVQPQQVFHLTIKYHLRERQIKLNVYRNEDFIRTLEYSMQMTVVTSEMIGINKQEFYDDVLKRLKEEKNWIEFSSEADTFDIVSNGGEKLNDTISVSADGE